MSKNIIIVLVSGFVLVIIGAGILLSKQNSTEEQSNRQIPNTEVSITRNVTIGGKDSPEVPLPTEEDIIRTFITLIDEHRPVDAITMMESTFVGDDSSKQMWGVQFNAFDSIKIDNVEPSMKDEWSTDSHTYKVTVTSKMKPEAAQAPIPNYGWENGTNIRWITITKVGTQWKISGIATGP